MRFYWATGKEHGNYYNGLYRDSIGAIAFSKRFKPALLRACMAFSAQAFGEAKSFVGLIAQPPAASLNEEGFAIWSFQREFQSQLGCWY